MSKDKAEILASRLKDRNIVLRDVEVCHCRIKNNALNKFVRLGGLIVLCHDINGLLKGLRQEYKPSDWRLFIDSSQRRLKMLLLHNGIPDVPFRSPAIYT